MVIVLVGCHKFLATLLKIVVILKIIVELGVQIVLGEYSNF